MTNFQLEERLDKLGCETEILLSSITDIQYIIQELAKKVASIETATCVTSKEEATALASNILHSQIKHPPIGTPLEQQDLDEDDGKATSCYDLPYPPSEEFPRPTLDDLIEHKKMPFGIANIFKATYALTSRSTRSSSSSETRELNKIIYYANRRLAQLARQSN